MNRRQMVARIERHWDEFNEACRGLSHAALAESGVVEDWSVKDLMAHVATWEAETMAALPIFMQGGRPTYGDVDGFNAESFQTNQNLSTQQAWQTLQKCHARLLDFLSTVPETWYETETPFRRRLRTDTWGHYPEHARAILAWRHQKGL